ncbi:hypothetical protein ACFWTC_34365 [Streptomyces sp. NPDC058619]|uniref:hypothetical protein n=1 Tax=unclassified Streptomyces TaxID=2593676 RepID=UPI00364D4BC1
MDDTPMPEPLRRAVHQLVAEAVTNCQEVLSYTEPFAAHDWKRMTLYRATDAADMMNTAAMLIAAYCQDTDMGKDQLDGFLQLCQQRNRAWAPGTPTGPNWPVCWADRRPPAPRSRPW